MPPNMYRRTLCTALGLLCISAAAHAEGAQVVSDECHEILHKESADPAQRERCLEEYRAATSSYEVVVTAGRVEEELAKVPASIAVVPALEIERSHAESIAEALRDVPGVDISDAGEPGMKRIRIRGEDAKRVTILIDGQEFFDPRDVGTPILLSPDMVERIEVLRGPASVMYGSRAFGGVINIITKKGGYHPVQASAGTLFDSSTRGFQEFGSVFGEAEGIEYRVSAAGSDQGNRHSGHGEVDPSAYRNKNSLIYLGKQFEAHHFGLNYQMYDGKSDVYVEPEVRTTPPFVDFKIEAPQRDREKYAFFYDYEPQDSVIKSAHVDVYRQLSVRQLDTYSTTVVDPVSQARADTSILSFSNMAGLGGNAYIDLAIADDASLLIGAQVSSDDLRQTRDRSVQMASGTRPPESTVDEASLDSVAGYTRVRWEFVPSWEATLGGRASWTESSLDETNRAGLSPQSSDDSAAIGTAGLLYSGIKDTSLWLNVGQGYQYPSLSQSATGAFAGPSFVNPNFELEPETSWEMELGGRYQADAFQMEGALFYSDASEYIDHVLCSSTTARCIEPTGTRDRVYVNIDSAKTWGGEGELRYTWQEWSPYVRGTWLRRQLDRTDYTTLDSGIAPLSGRMGVQYESEISGAVGIWGDLFMRAESRAEEFDGKSTLTNPGWATLNAAFGAEFGPKHLYRASVEFLNIFDKYYHTATENIPAPGSAVIIRLSGQW